MEACKTKASGSLSLYFLGVSCELICLGVVYSGRFCCLVLCCFMS